MGWFLAAVVAGAIGVLVWKRRGNPGSEDLDVQSLRDVGGHGGSAQHPGSGSVGGKLR